MNRRISTLETQFNIFASETNDKFEQLAMQNNEIINLLQQNGIMANNAVNNNQMPTPIPQLPPMLPKNYGTQHASIVTKMSSGPMFNSAFYSIPK